MSRSYDPDTGALIPNAGAWPVDPQDDQPIDKSRLWIDGCFDFFHHGHTGVMLQSRRLGNELLVGMHTDAEIAANKGPTVMNLEERVAAVDACRFSTKSVPYAPYTTSLAWITHYGCWYVTHGDDITSDANGEDCYRYVKTAGRMKIVKRTGGISTTDLVGRMLLCTKEHFIHSFTAVLNGQEGSEIEEERLNRAAEMKQRLKEYAAAPNGIDAFVPVYVAQHDKIEDKPILNGEPQSSQPQPHGKATFKELVLGFSPRPGQRIVYVDGGFDLFSSGHIAFLEAVTELERKLGEARGWYTDEARKQRLEDSRSDYGPAYVVAGIHDDEVINHYRGVNYPIMNIYERGLCVVQCQYIHSAVFSAPYTPDKAYLISLPVGIPDVVYHGPTAFLVSTEDPYADAKHMGIFQQVEKHRFQDVNSAQIVQRILNKRSEYEERQRKKGVKTVGEEAARREEMEREAEASRKSALEHKKVAASG